MTNPSDPPSDRESPPAWQPGHPNWRPPRDRDGRYATVFVGLLFLVIGTWFFLERTLGITMPSIEWDAVWPVILIVLGLIVLIRYFRESN
jgi:hypothetical protein